MAANFGGGSVVNANGSVSAPSYTVQGTNYNNVGSAIAALDGGLTGMQGNLASLQNKVDRNMKKANAGTASAMAATGLRYDDRPGKISTAVGVAHYGGQAGFSAGIGGTSFDSDWRVNGALTITPSIGGKTEVGVIGGFSHTWN